MHKSQKQNRTFSELGGDGSGILYAESIFSPFLIKKLFSKILLMNEVRHPIEQSPFATVPIDFSFRISSFEIRAVLGAIYSRAYFGLSEIHIQDILPISIPNTYISVKVQGPGESHPLHVDKARGTYGYGSGDDLYMSSIIILNDEYGGGELVFPSIDTEIKLKTGSMIVFPSAGPEHLVKTVTSGKRYSLLQFWQHNQSGKI